MEIISDFPAAIASTTLIVKTLFSEAGFLSLCQEKQLRAPTFIGLQARRELQ